jgi:REP element-mobilizing transposase RayT
MQEKEEETERADQEIGVPGEKKRADREIGVPGEKKRADREIGVPGEKKRADREIGVPGGDPRGWYSRGYLPHFDGYATTQHVTIHLADSLPADVVARLEREIVTLPEEKRDIERRKRIEAWIDAGHGSCVLREPAVAAMVQNALLFFDGQRYRLLAWVVMPNHVHVLFQPVGGWTMAKIVASWKKFTATRIRAFLRSSGPGNANLPIGGFPGNANLPIGAGADPIWHREYWDRFIRDARHFQQTVDYIHNNPVKVGLAAEAQQWMWSSASTMQEKKKKQQDANREIGVPGEKKKRADQEIGVPGEKKKRADQEIGVPGEKKKRADQEIGVPGFPGIHRGKP